MCSGIVCVQVRIARLGFGRSIPKMGTIMSLDNMSHALDPDPKLEVASIRNIQHLWACQQLVVRRCIRTSYLKCSILDRA